MYIDSHPNLLSLRQHNKTRFGEERHVSIPALRATLFTTAAIVFGAHPAAAQTGDPGQTSPASAAAAGAAQEDGSEIIVTARRRDERLMGVPVVVSALSQETLERYNADSLQNIGDLTPTVIVAPYKINGGGSIAIRGISTPANQIGFEQAVSVAIDGVQTANGHIAQLGLFDLQQVEILKGPQALFFGKNNTAGVMSVITAGPTRSFEASLRTGFEFNAAEFITEGTVSGPISDTLGARLAVRYRNMDGYLRNLSRATTNPFYNPATGAPAAAGLLPGANDDRPGEEEFLGRLTLRFEPSSEFRATLRVFGAHSEDSGPGVSSQNIGPCTGPNPRVSGVADPFGECVPDNRISLGDIPPVIAATIKDYPVDGSPRGELDAILASLNMELDIGQFTLTSLTGYSRVRYYYNSGADQTTFSQLAQLEGQVQRDVSQELRIASNFEGPLNFTLGAFFSDSGLFAEQDTKLNDGNFNAASGRYVSFQWEARQAGRTESAFGQLNWDITDQLELAGGARWTRETKNYNKFNLYGIGAFNTLGTSFPGSDRIGVLQGRFRDENISPEVTLTWRPDSNHTLFAAFRTGFKSGGFGLTNPLSVTSTISGVDFGSETVSGFEVGGRAILFDGRLNLSAAAFAYDYDDLQVNTYDPAAIAYTINNAGSVRQRGFELEGNFRASRILTLHGALAYVNNEFRDFTGQCYSYTFPTGTTRATAVAPPNCSFVNATALTLQQVYDGRTPARSPEWSGNGGFVFDIPVGGLRLGLTGDAYYTSSYYAADTLAPPTLQDGFWRLNASVSIASADDRWELALQGRNLSNEYYVLYAVDRTGGAGVPGAIGEQRGVVSRGREIMLQATMRF
jgi:iron complex outermembrane receptor protein